MRRHGWILLFHDCIVKQLQKVYEASERARRKDPEGYQGNANVRLFRALTHLMLEAIPSEPGRDEYRQGNTLGPAFRHWRRAKVGRRFRLFYRYDSRSRTIVFAWVNDQQSLRAVGSKSDPYAVFRKMLMRGNPPDDWKTLVEASRADWKM
ncbi:type II toxin-antitoxin system YhaV family toxin [Wenzhouxiangella sp. AB-CW3]|uniref:type II toxin-antitoxin system YhaV family toxin n=1 Tax=Wenzhouxiangella sp. AB-CW3 TaxID=2771012 RepID=UPI00168B039A|nr:type II toxin-antitoxin system YhaV family toxin [Wenzhouxiangella sp. AB-CW3]QOC23797.1 type II toxin-antitoxin system YhaV family toxin [Wenzhouxiangella sp. AB-CW3]